MPQGGAGTWRLDVKDAGSGVTGDLLAHCVDTAIWLNGGINEVSGMTEPFVKERKNALTGEMQPVGIDDASLFLARFALLERAQGPDDVTGVLRVENRWPGGSRFGERTS